MAQFLESIDTFAYEVVVPEIGDYLRSAEILRKFNEQNLDFVDACIVAMAERLNITTMLTSTAVISASLGRPIAIRSNCCLINSFN